jgi:hypothetical protein
MALERGTAAGCRLATPIGLASTGLASSPALG